MEENRNSSEIKQELPEVAGRNWTDTIERMKNANTFSYYNHLIYDEISLDYCRMHLDIAPESRNPEGNVHGGCYFSLADSCAGGVARSDGNIWVSLDASCNFLRSIAEGRITAVGRTKRRGNTVCVVDVELFDESERLLFSAVFSLFRVTKR